MIEQKHQNEFLSEFTEELEEKAIKAGSYQVPFLEKMLTFMDRPEDPEILFPPFTERTKNIALNAYAFDEENKSLDLYVTEYSFDQSPEELLSVNRAAVTEMANKAKRFFTNSKTLLSSLDRSLQTYEIAKIIDENSKEIEEVNIFVITNYFYLVNKPIELTIPGIETVNVQVWDIDRIQQLVSVEQGVQSDHIDFESQLGQTFDMMLVPDSVQGGTKRFDCYVGYISAELLAKAYEAWGPKLVERNVRSFLQARGGTNKGIRNTLKDPIQRKMFVAYNNGISTVASSGNFEKISDAPPLYRFKGLDGWQIVNGGQTTASIFQAYKEGVELKDVFVQAKLTILRQTETQNANAHYLEDELVSRISEYSNTQNKINKSDLLANSRFMSELEKFSRNIWIPTMDGRKAESKWYFERARGQYMVDINRRPRGKAQTDFKKQFPKDKVLTKVDIAKHFMCWEGYPHTSSKGGEEAFNKFMDFNKLYWKADSGSIEKMSLSIYKKMIARSIVYSNTANVVDEMKLRGYKANVIYYTVAMLNKIYGDQIDLIEVWEQQALSGKWKEVIRIIADKTLFYLKDSAGERNVTQWAKQEACWIQYQEACKKELSNLI